jgi:hypothetical protein
MHEPNKPPTAAPLHGVVIPRKCKDIPDQPILEFLLSHKGKWCNWYFGDERDVHLAMPASTPEKLVLAKMRMLIRRGVVTGCPCGCRGDFEITEKGEASLASTSG